VNVVVDASAGLVLASGDGFGALRERVAEAAWVGAPALYDFEVTNAVWKYVKLGGWNEDQGRVVLERALALPEERIDGETLALEALALARRHDHPAYDLFYLVFARRMDALIATLDQKLIKLAKRVGVKTDGKLARR
jgi:predicted nucleic acid-binding protein